MKKNRDFCDDCSYNDRAKNYVRALKARFHNQPEKFHSFNRVMNNIMAERAQPDGLKSIPTDAPTRLKAILEGHNDLVYGLNFFLPPSYRVSLDGDDEQEEDGKETERGTEEKTISGFEDAKDLIQKVRTRGEKVYGTFLKTLLSTNQNRSFDDVCSDVVELFTDHPDLLEDFKKFMPVYEAIPLRSYAPKYQIPNSN